MKIKLGVNTKFTGTEDKENIDDNNYKKDIQDYINIQTHIKNRNPRTVPEPNFYELDLLSPWGMSGGIEKHDSCVEFTKKSTKVDFGLRRYNDKICIPHGIDLKIFSTDNMTTTFYQDGLFTEPLPSYKKTHDKQFNTISKIRYSIERCILSNKWKNFKGIYIPLGVTIDNEENINHENMIFLQKETTDGNVEKFTMYLFDPNFEPVDYIVEKLNQVIGLINNHVKQYKKYQISDKVKFLNLNFPRIDLEICISKNQENEELVTKNTKFEKLKTKMNKLNVKRNELIGQMNKRQQKINDLSLIFNKSATDFKEWDDENKNNPNTVYNETFNKKQTEQKNEREKIIAEQKIYDDAIPIISDYDKSLEQLQTQRTTMKNELGNKYDNIFDNCSDETAKTKSMAIHNLFPEGWIGIGICANVTWFSFILWSLVCGKIDEFETMYYSLCMPVYLYKLCLTDEVLRKSLNVDFVNKLEKLYVDFCWIVQKFMLWSTEQCKDKNNAKLYLYKYKSCLLGNIIHKQKKVSEADAAAGGYKIKTNTKKTKTKKTKTKKTKTKKTNTKKTKKTKTKRKNMRRKSVKGKKRFKRRSRGKK
jgi:hypothetical protein